MSVEENKALIRRLYDEVFAKWNLGVIDELVGSEFVGRCRLERHAGRSVSSSFTIHFDWLSLICDTRSTT